MTTPEIAISSFGVKLLLKQAEGDRKMINFASLDTDNFDTGFRALNVEGVTYQVPAGKELLLTGATIWGSALAVGTQVRLTSSTVSATTTGEVELYRFQSQTGEIGGIRALGIIVAENLFLNYVSTTLNRSIRAIGLQGVEYTPTP